MCRFSTSTTEASTMTPMAMAMPPRLMMLALMPSNLMRMSAMRMPTGSVNIATNAERKCNRKMMQMKATTSISSMSLTTRVSTNAHTPARITIPVTMMTMTRFLILCVMIQLIMAHLFFSVRSMPQMGQVPGPS